MLNSYESTSTLFKGLIARWVDGESNIGEVAKSEKGRGRSPKSISIDTHVYVKHRAHFPLIHEAQLTQIIS